MAFDPVPLAIGEGAEHSDDVWRVFANAATHDAQGIVLPGDMKVTSGGAGVATIAPGGVVIRNAQKAGQSYVGYAPTPTNHAYPDNTGGGSTARHLLIARVIDPQFSPWQPSGTPGEPNVSVPDGPYFEPFLVPGVAAGTTRASQVVSYSAQALARIDVPAGGSTGTFVDCRELFAPRVGFAFDVQQAGGTDDLQSTQTTFRDFTTNSLQVYVPRWATHAQVSVDFLSIKASNATGRLRLVLGGTNGPEAIFDNAAAQVESVPFSVYGEFNVQAVQDSSVTLKVQARRTGGDSGALKMYASANSTFLKFDVKFSERVV